jgi:hypothetical protein
MGGDRVTVIAGVPDQRLAWTERLTQLVRLSEHALHRRDTAGLPKPLGERSGQTIQ